MEHRHIEEFWVCWRQHLQELKMKSYVCCKHKWVLFRSVKMLVRQASETLHTIVNTSTVYLLGEDFLIFFTLGGILTALGQNTAVK